MAKIVASIVAFAGAYALSLLCLASLFLAATIRSKPIVYEGYAALFLLPATLALFATPWLLRRPLPRAWLFHLLAVSVVAIVTFGLPVFLEGTVLFRPMRFGTFFGQIALCAVAGIYLGRAAHNPVDKAIESL